jgi:outer membrane lipoprotein
MLAMHKYIHFHSMKYERIPGLINRRKEKQMPNSIYHVVSALCLIFLIAGCTRYEVIPERLENQVNYKLRFSDIKDNPDAHKGEIVVVGGEVLSIERMEDRTQIEVLQLPLDKDELVPANRRTTTEGRFIALSRGKDTLDPAVLEEETAITIVGEILGSDTITIDKDQRRVPVLGIKDLTIWDEARYWGAPYGGYGYGWGWGYPAGFYSGYRPFGYPYY